MKIFILFFLLSININHALANAYNEARSVLQQSLSEMLEKLENKPAGMKDKEQGDQFYYDVARSVLDIVDMEVMSKLVLGRHWKNADDGQRRRFVYGFEKMLIKSYAKQTALLANVQIEFLPAPEEISQRKYQIIHTQVKTADGHPPLQVNYSMTNNNGWKVFDFIVDGVSILNQFRQNFDAEIRETSLHALISRLNGMNASVPAEGSQ